MVKIKTNIIRRVGGKYRIADWIIAHIPPHKIYVEPFGGAASVLLKKPSSFMEVYNDIDSDLVNMFLIARNNPSEFMERFDLIPYSREIYYNWLYHCSIC